MECIFTCRLSWLDLVSHDLWGLRPHVLHLMVFGLMLHVLYVLIESMDTCRSMSMDGDIEC